MQIDRCGIWQANDVNSQSSGAFNLFETLYKGAELILDSYSVGVNFDASGSSSIFGASQKVQPKGYQLLMIIKS